MKEVVGHPLALIITLFAVAGCRANSERTEERLDLVPIARFGSVDGSVSLQEIMSVTLSPGGDTLFVTQFAVPSVLALNGLGDSLFSSGRSGGGPGEFSMMPGAITARGDSIFVADPLTASVSTFWGPDLLSAQRYDFPVLGEFQRPPTIRGFGRGRDLILRGGTTTTSVSRGLVEMVPWVVADGTDGTIRDTILWERVSGSMFTLDFDPGLVTGRHPLPLGDLVAVDPSGDQLVVGRSITAESGVSVEVTWVSLSGDSLGALALPTLEISSEQALDDFVEEMTHDGERSRVAVEQAIAEQMEWPQTLPGLLDIFIDSDARTWMKTPAAIADSARWYVVEPDRSILGYVTVPEHVTLEAALGNDVWGWAPGTYDVPFILRFRLNRGTS